jgi:hypothetical protein
MNDITESVLVFRENLRHLWNTTGRHLVVSEYRFGEIEWNLFKNTVLTEAEPCIPDDEYSEYFESIKVEPTFEWTNSNFLYGFKKEKNLTWEIAWKTVQLSRQNELDLRFKHFYDFNIQGFKEYRYARAKVINAKNCIDIIGSDLLIEATSCKYINISV